MGLIILLLVIFIIVIFVTRIRIVPQANVYVVERLGAFYKGVGHRYPLSGTVHRPRGKASFH